MVTKKIIAWASAGAIIIAGVGTAAGVTAHNLNVARAEAERESMSVITDFLTTQPAPVDQTTPKDTTAAPATVPQTTAGDGGSKATTAPKTEVQTTKITWAYDADLSKQVSRLIEKKYSDMIYDETLFRKSVPGNFIQDGIIQQQNDKSMYIGNIKNGSDTAQQIINSWTNMEPVHSVFDNNKWLFCVTVYKYSDGQYYVCFC